MKDFWEDLPAKTKRMIVLAVVAVAFIAVVAWMNSGEESRDRRSRNADDNVVRNVLTDRDTSQVRVERLAAELENIRAQNRELNRTLERMDRDARRSRSGAEVEELEEALQALQGEVERIQTQRERSTSGEAYGVVDLQPQEEPSAPGGQTSGPSSDPIAELGRETDPMWRNGGAPVVSGDPEDPGVGEFSIRSLERSRSEADEAEALETSDRENEIYLPAGAIITGTLVTGLDAPTGTQARQDPHPALLRVKHEAILPNRFTADIRECFILIGGHGSLSQERAIMRSERISCVLDDGGVVETRLEAYAVGEDGKAGIRGRLVSKQGQALAKAMIAGGLESFGQAFSRNPLPQLSIGDSDKQVYQQAFSNDALQSGAVGSFGRAMDRLAQFWIDQAEAIFPVIEIDAGREIEIVLVRGTSIQVSSNGSAEQ